MLVARKASCCVANAFSTGLKVIWLRCSLKITKMSKKRSFSKKVPEVNGLIIIQLLQYLVNWCYCVIREILFATNNCCLTKGTLQNHKWENALTVDKGSWGYRRNVDIDLYLNISQLLYQLASTVRWGLSCRFLKSVPMRKPVRRW